MSGVVKLVSAGADLIDPEPDTDTTGDSDTLEDNELGADKRGFSSERRKKEHRNSDEILVNLYDNLRYLNIKHRFYNIEF